jgi:DNA polymerase
LLNEMLLAIGLRRDEVYIANVIKSRPPNNREPLPDEIEACMPFVARQIALVSPKIILSVGRVSAQSLLKTKTNIGALRGRRFFYEDTRIPLVVTYHPAYLLRSPAEKRKVWQDLLLARRVYRESLGEVAA